MPEADLDIETIAAGGDGVGRMEGLVAFVPRTAPGDRAHIRYASTRRFARGELIRLLRESPQRIASACPHYGVDRCGGCQLQHLTYEAQLSAKAHIVRDALVRIARRDVSLPEVVPSPRQWRYRSKLTLALRRRGDGWIAGLHPYDDPVAVFQLDDCPITAEPVVALWRTLMSASQLFPRANGLRGAVQVTDDTSSFTLEGGKGWSGHAELFAAVPALTELWWSSEDGSPRRLHHRASDTAAASFAQINASLADALHDHVVARALSYAPSTVVDAYAGRGATSLALAARDVTVTAIEVDRAAAEWMRSRLPATSRIVAGRVEDVLGQSLPADVVVLNPPRSGVAEPVTQLLAASASTRAIVYVSCDPATLARDVARLPDFRIAAIRAFDMFPQTAHVETVCELVR